MKQTFVISFTLYVSRTAILVVVITSSDKVHHPLLFVQNNSFSFSDWLYPPPPTPQIIFQNQQALNKFRE